MKKKVISILFVTLFLLIPVVKINSLSLGGDYNKSAEELVNKILGSGVSATNTKKTGTVYSFVDEENIFGINSGIILDTSGRGGESENDSDLESIMDYEYGGHTSSLEFTLKATGNLLNFNYVFSSGEFECEPQYNDVFALFVSVNGGEYENIAKITKDNGDVVPVNITNLKNGLSGNEYVDIPEAGKQYSLYKGTDMQLDSGGGYYDEETGETIPIPLTLTGISNVFNAQKEVNIGDEVKVKFVIADVSDDSVDSFVLIEGDSLSFEPKNNKIQIIQPSTPNAYNSSIKNSASELESKIPFTQAEKEAMENDKNLLVYLEVKDISDIVPAIDKEKFLSSIEENDKIGMFLDVNLFKKIDGEEPVKITELNSPITISFEMPEKLINKDSSVNRKYTLYLLHNGEVTKKDVTINGNIGTFEADRFSTYLLTYSDTPNTSNPATGDNLFLYIALAVLSLTGLTSVGFYIKKVLTNK